jgi:hypothetical protein
MMKDYCGLFLSSPHNLLKIKSLFFDSYKILLLMIIIEG